MSADLIVHLPLPYFNGDQLVRTLRSNHRGFLGHGINIPDPKLYRRRISEFITDPKNTSISRIEEQLMWMELGGDGHKRTIISLPAIPNAPHEIVSDEGLMPDLNNAVRRLVEIFPRHRITICIGIVNPGNLMATLIQAKVGKDVLTLERAMQYEPLWVDAIGGCADDFPKVDFMVWEHEKSGFTWPKILRAVTGMPEGNLMAGSFDMIAHVMRKNGIDRMTSYVRELRPRDDENLSRIIEIFSGKFPDPEAPDRRIRIPEWSPELIEDFEEVYREDIESLRTDKRIRMIS